MADRQLLLHKGGGIVFFVLALLFLAPVLWALVRSESDGRCLRWFNFWPIKSNRA